MHFNLLQIFTRIYLHELSGRLQRTAKLADISDETLREWADSGFDYVWMLGVWQTGQLGREVSRTEPQWQNGFSEVLPDLTEGDISGSPFAIQSYSLHPDFGTAKSLKKFRSRLQRHGLKLILDFVPNHVAIDHPWTVEHPDYFVTGTEAELQSQPQNFRRCETEKGVVIFAHGRDPYFDGWPDTLQLNYQNRNLKQAMVNELLKIGEMCDGVRCDMAMLVSPDIFSRTWGERLAASSPSRCDDYFWPTAIESVKENNPDFVFMAEVYWDLEAEMLHQGFDFAYDKRLYDRLRSLDAGAVRGHLHAGSDYQNRLVRFLENHDEPRAAATFSTEVHPAAALITFLTPGMRLFYDGQFEGRRIHASVHLNRRPDEVVEPHIQEFYRSLLTCLQRPEVRSGHWQLLDCQPAWDGNSTSNQFIAFTWDHDDEILMVVVNYSAEHGECLVRFPFAGYRGKHLRLVEQFSDTTYERDGIEMLDWGLYVDLPAWGFHVFAIED